jgi:hypothetical protein
MQGATVIEISLLIPPQPHDIETESEDPRPFEIRRASHLHDIFVKASAYLRLHKHTSAPIQMIEVEQITPDRVVLDMPAKLLRRLHSGRCEHHFIREVCDLVVNAFDSLRSSSSVSLPFGIRYVLLVQDLHCLNNELDDHSKSIQRIFLPHVSSRSIELV